MPVYRELDPATILAAIAGIPNEIEGPLRVQEAFYRQQRCHSCGSQHLTRQTDTRHCFADPDSIVARSLLRCTECHYLFDPHTGMTIEMGNPGRIPDPVHILGRTTD
jgi:hypothetical protein